MFEKIYNHSPNFIQNILISVFNILAYRKRHGGDYKKYLHYYSTTKGLSLLNLRKIQKERYKKFIEHAINNSEYYNTLYKDVECPTDLRNIQELPVIGKEELRTNISKIYTVSEKDGIVSKTGGTTGKSLQVLYTKENMQERFALLDSFRSNFGYNLGKKTAWFSGKSLISNSDIKNNRFWKTDYWFNVRYYSTFHIKDENLEYYIKDLIFYKPEFFVGFPSTIAQIAKYGLKNNIEFPANIIKAIFPTAETVTKEMREQIEVFFKTKIFDQYASSEGAPFIFECTSNNLHLELQSGIFEVLDFEDQPSNSGRLVVTSFTTQGTPLIRYDIGDSITLIEGNCNCGNNNPLVKEILGRIDDYIYSPETGKINLGNVSNTLKDTKGIMQFQVIQDELNEILIKLTVDRNLFDKKIEKRFLENWRARVGSNMVINLEYTTDLQVEKSGKFRMVKNNIKHLTE